MLFRCIFYISLAFALSLDEFFMKRFLTSNRAIPILMLVVLLSLCVFVIFPYARPSVEDVIIESTIFAVCIYLLFSFHELREVTGIYSVLFVSTSFLTIGNSIDLLDEFFEIDHALGLVEDVFTAVGFIVFLFGCTRWVKRHTKQLEQMRHLAEIDSLTGVSNRRAFLKLTEEYFELNEKNSDHVSVLVIDVDDFKAVNDTHGHPVGDKVLMEIANTIKLALRKGDYVARLGGEEFVVFLKDTTHHEAMVTAERIRSGVQDLDNYHNDIKVKATVSIGASTSDMHQLKFEALYEQADLAMYQAKSAGKNRCCAYADVNKAVKVTSANES